MPSFTLEFEPAIAKIPAPVQFNFTKIANAQDGFTSFHEVVLNETGLVAFTAGRNSDPNPSGVFTGNGTLIRTIADVRDRQFEIFGKIAMNNTGNVVFAAGNDGEITGVYKNYLRTNPTIADMNGLRSLFRDVSPPMPVDNPTTYSLSGDFAMNDSGVVLFDASVNYRTGADQTNQRLFLNHNSSNNKIAEANDFSLPGISQSTTFTDLQVNRSGQALYVRTTQQQTPQPISTTTIVFAGKDIANVGIAPAQFFTETERIFSPVLTETGSVFYAHSQPDADSTIIYRFDAGTSAPISVSKLELVDDLKANDRGRVVVSGSTGEHSGLFFLNEGTITQISDRASTNFLINNFNEIVFQLNDLTTSEIVTRFGSTNQRLIGTGDAFQGSTVSQVQLRGFNDAGQIAFSVNFTDGTQGIFRAAPTARSSSYETFPSVNGSVKLPQNDLNLATNPIFPSASLL
jgi:hypothetical protein